MRSSCGSRQGRRLQHTGNKPLRCAGEIGTSRRSCPVPSSVIQSFVYDKEEQRLGVRFVSGKVYTYDDVPGATVAGFRAAASKGTYFNDVIRDRFPFARRRSRGR